MSGPKGARYRVTSQAEIRRRQRASEAAALRQAEQRWARVQEQWKQARLQYGPAIGSPDSTAGRSGGTARQTSDLLEQCARSEARLRTAISAAQAAVMVASLRSMPGVGAVRPSSHATRRDTSSTEPAQAQPPAWHVDRVSTIERVLGRCDSDVPSDVRAGIEQLAGAALQASENRWESIADRLRMTVQNANSTVAARRVAVTELRSLESLLADLPAGTAAPFQAEIDGQLLLPRPLVGDLGARIAAARAAMTREQDRAYVAQTMQKVLGELDFDAEAEFSTLLVEQGVAYVRSDSWGSQHAVRVRLPKDGVSASFNVVRDSEYTSAADDVHAEQTWCSSFEQLAGALADEGVALDLEHRLPVGAVALPTVPAQRLLFGERGTRSQRLRGDHA